MIFENAMLGTGETIDVGGVTYTVRNDGDWLHLELKT
jgi:hypothetical protein